jgi:hypothetical protein
MFQRIDEFESIAGDNGGAYIGNVPTVTGAMF